MRRAPLARIINFPRQSYYYYTLAHNNLSVSNSRASGARWRRKKKAACTHIVKGRRKSIVNRKKRQYQEDHFINHSNDIINGSFMVHQGHYGVYPSLFFGCEKNIFEIFITIYSYKYPDGS